MIPQIEQHRRELEDLCRKYHVARLEVFGSAADGSFDPARSDLDFLVEFKPDSPMSGLDQYFGLQGDLQGLFELKVDLVMTGAMKNPYFIKNINATRRLLYAA